MYVQTIGEEAATGRDVEMLAYAEKIAKDASQVSQADIDRLRAVGFTDQQICDIALLCLISLLCQPLLRYHGRRSRGRIRRQR
jgi:alkylhydroperoxidase family enzyme